MHSRAARAWRATYVIVLVTAVATLSPASSFGSPGGSPELGKSIYSARCAQCHGENGKGDGPASSLLYPKPRDFTSGQFKIKSTESGSLPTDDDLLGAIRHGLPGSAMPDWEPFLRGDSLKAVLAYVKSFSPRFGQERPKPLPSRTINTTPAAIASGKRVYAKLQCAACHGTDGTGTDAESTDLLDDLGNETSAANLTQPWTFRGGSTAGDIYLRLRTGMDGSPMPSFKSAASDAELMNLSAYVVSLARKPVWSMNAAELKALFDKQDADTKQNPVARGKYLVRSFGCGFCHTPLNTDGSMMEDFKLAGGQKMDLYPFGTYVTYNLTSDKETGLGAWTDQQIRTFLTSGVRRDGSRMLPFPMPWAAYAGMKEEDLNAIIAYLRTIDPIYNKIPLPKSEGFFSYLWGKFQLLILKKDIPALTFPGNSGMPKENAMSSNDAVREEVKP